MNPSRIRDGVAFRSSLRPLKEPSFRVIAALQDVEASVQIDALALTLTLMADAVGLDPHALITRARRQIADADAVKNPHLEAVRDYAAGELR